MTLVLHSRDSISGSSNKAFEGVIYVISAMSKRSNKISSLHTLGYLCSSGGIQAMDSIGRSSHNILKQGAKDFGWIMGHRVAMQPPSVAIPSY
ncbi:uncharacterized protein A4U43_C07F26970 [Asparagus officinalis]|uniref:Uncharacterized protein n=1 Tax=Asparagus officinalis TaxID=4686 RepID=A0A5P1EF97_ASPOF|nr:uncharacterized protein A4U43_C07F26970 [Asparagus officinalis]